MSRSGVQLVPGTGSSINPVGVAIDPAGSVYVADVNNGRIQKFTSAGVYLNHCGACTPYLLGIDACGNIYISATGCHAIDKFAAPPAVALVSDIGSDEGRQVSLRILRSSADSPGSGAPVLRYDVFRRIDPLAKAGGDRIEGWDQVGSISAYGDAVYNLVVPTLVNATAASVEYSAFLVRAATADPYTYFESGVENGYSIDNLSPPAPTAFRGNYLAGAMHLHWDVNTAADFAAFHLHRGATAAFVPGAGNLVAALTDTGYVDVSPAGSYYKLSAADFDGNESGFALVSPTVTSVEPTGAAVALSIEGTPNPAVGGRVIVRFALPRNDPATIEVFDLSGRRVLTRVVGSLGVGTHSSIWRKSTVSRRECTSRGCSRGSSNAGFGSWWWSKTGGHESAARSRIAAIRRAIPKEDPMFRASRSLSLPVLATLLLFSVAAQASTAPTTPTFVLAWGNQGNAPGQFYNPSGVATDALGNVYVVDQSNSRMEKFDRLGNLITQWGSVGSADGQFNWPYSVAIDAAGNVFVADRGNSRIQKFTSAGVFLTKWGSAGSGNGQFSDFYGIATDGDGNVYAADTDNHRIQKFTGAGVFLTKWGAWGSGNGQFDSPVGVTVDSGGHVYVADYNNHRIQKFDAAGLYLTKWGSLGSADGQFNQPRSVSVDALGHVYVADTNNNRIQKFDGTGAFIAKWGSAGAGNGSVQLSAGRDRRPRRQRVRGRCRQSTHPEVQRGRGGAGRAGGLISAEVGLVRCRERAIQPAPRRGHRRRWQRVRHRYRQQPRPEVHKHRRVCHAMGIVRLRQRTIQWAVGGGRGRCR